MASDRKNGLRAADATANTASRVVTEPTFQQSAAPASLPVASTPSATAPAEAAHSASTATPAAQIAPALLTMAKSADGNQQLTVQLHPADLGMVQIKIERAVSGMTQIDITADKPETLQTLQRDQSALHRALDDAGIPTVGRTVAFHTVPPAAAPASSGSTGTGSGQGGQHAPPGRANNGSTDAGGSSANGRNGYPTREARSWPTGRPPSPGSAGAPATGTQTYRVGLDITA